MIDILSLDKDELTSFLVDLGEHSFRSKQIFDWLHNKKIKHFDEMSNISKTLVNKLKNNAEIKNTEVLEVFNSNLDGTKKYLLKLYDNEIIECVLMSYKHGFSICISTQAGCKMGCNFCASTKNGFKRDLLPSEMLQQIYEIERINDINISNIVLMGIGEPFDNFDNVIKFTNLVTDESGKNVGARHITISTCGLVDKIIKFADLKTQINLAVSLHNPNSYERSKIMPVNLKFNVNELLRSLDYYISTTNRRVTIEYALIDGQNDTLQHAMKMVEYFKNKLFHVNLIPINKVSEFNCDKSSINNIKRFENYIKKNNIPVTVRRTMGADIDAACGQLRRNYKEVN
ncbi:MAG: 23S rRNA (adenine(2503)-C(2))-methyltransferase RlmN [Oscillospiraceae bacterium]